jgi:hypothetical protein
MRVNSAEFAGPTRAARTHEVCRCSGRDSAFCPGDIPDAMDPSGAVLEASL